MHRWQPGISLDHLHFRATALDRMRDFFKSRGYLEVETPYLSQFGVTDIHLHPVTATVLQQTMYLHTSPEYPMKRLLAAGSGSIFQLARVFRDEEIGRLHQPEFTMLEWYRVGWDHHTLLTEIDTFLQIMLHCPPLVKRRYQEVFETYLGCNPIQTSIMELQQIAKQHDLGTVLDPNTASVDDYLYLLMSHLIEPQFSALEMPVALYDFPASQAALAKIENGVAARFEVYFRGMELANGFYELSDVEEQSQRFQVDSDQRIARDLPVNPIDQRFL
ncbi:MAG: elongation factor P--(R)-beta-lysine ligase, partial [Legionellaceae bacterium]|nr:elongation factor P--(R)-beta-lysine ligase [Legionellaceae bacterium]